MKSNKFYLMVFIIILYFSIIFQISSSLSTNNSLEFNWSRKWGGQDVEIGYGAAIDSSDNIYFTGTSYSFGPGDSAIVLLKYDDSGSLLWNITWGGSSYDLSYGVTVDSLDNIYLAGETGSFGAGGVDMVLVKYDSSGEQLWNRTWGGSAMLNVDKGWGVEVDSLENVYLVGVSNNFGAGEEDIILVKYDSYGIQLWNRTWGGSLSDFGYAIAIDSLDYIYLVGTTFSSGAGEEDIILVKYDSSGTPLWDRTWGGGLSDIGYGIAIDSTGNIYLTGITNSFGTGMDDMVLVRFDNSGTQLWNRTWGGNSFDSGSDIVIDSAGNVYVLGSTKSFSIEPDILLVKYNNSGTELWNHTWGGDNREICTCGAMDSSGNIYLGGHSDTYTSFSNMLLVRFGYKEEKGAGAIFSYNLLIIISLIGLITTIYLKKKYKK